MFLIKDNSTGQSYDIRHQETAKMLSEAEQKLTKISKEETKKAWSDWWQTKRDRNYDLQAAAEKGELEAIKDLLDEKKYGDLAADINAKGLDDFSPLHLAVNEGYIEAAKYLQFRGANLDAVTISLKTPLHIACVRGNIEAIEFLCEKKANLNKQDKDGNTPAHILAENGNAEALTRLLKKCPDLTIKNSFGETPIDIATTLEAREAFSKCDSLPLSEDLGYSRTIVDNMILRNNRADVIKSIMFKSRIFTEKKQSSPVSSAKQIKEEKSGAPESPVKELPTKESRTRIVKIIEAVHLMEPVSASKKEDKKAIPKAVEEGVVRPEDFEPVHLLGKGSFGEVYLTRYKPNGKEYAMKILPKKKVISQNLLKYAKAERNVLCYTKHPFIVGNSTFYSNNNRIRFCFPDIGELIPSNGVLPRVL